MILKIKQTTTTEKEIEINFPYVTYDSSCKRYYFNHAENKCIILNMETKSILNLSYNNDGLEFPEARKENFFNDFDLNLQELLTMINK